MGRPPSRPLRRRAATAVVVGALAAATLAPGAPAPDPRRCPRASGPELVRDGDEYAYSGFMSPDPRPAGVPAPVLFIVRDSRVRVETLDDRPRDVRVTATWGSALDDWFLEVRGRAGSYDSDRSQLGPGAEPREEVVVRGLRNCDELHLFVGNRLGRPDIRAQIEFTVI